ncbi:hypothetical protein Halha_2406 [Halobacteroides halobius DSM 5150]|uniref:Uncharacterized protein n=1 Tax=Halobacteroides halobius (strain ATCC 35273 / DSM 5150 / MD-1) TaxID=748449 RepID=L0KCM1_HALHC|nr:hypothetical protein [Halobacteroides halobius]AGB42280.1 hypothetical protein Halha_2406 [Halobacteroides halobius DSM 5150]
MKRITIFCLVVAILAIQAPVALAQTVKVDSKVVKVDQKELIELASSEKFDSLQLVLKKLVQQNLSTEKKIKSVKLKKITIINFKYSLDNILKIYYQLQ